MPPLRDDAWSWDDPTFTVDGVPTPGSGRSLTFQIPFPQEDIPTPNVDIVVNNNVTKTDGAWSVAQDQRPAQRDRGPAGFDDHLHADRRLDR